MGAPTTKKMDIAELIRTLNKSTKEMQEMTHRQRESIRRLRQELGLPEPELSELQQVLEKMVWPAPEREWEELLPSREPEGVELPSREPEGVELPSREPEGVELPLPPEGEEPLWPELEEKEVKSPPPPQP
ncbi:UNVERIFIED_CONTAM: hypothetical protein FKN15_015686 [Acipenser sinensis]